jgi:hypothetical protein
MKKLTILFKPASLWALTLGLGCWISLSGLAVQVACAGKGQRPEVLGASEEVPEEVLQIQVETEANSVLTGQPQTVDAYAQEQRQIQIRTTEVSPRLSPSIYRTMDLLRLRKLLKGLLPFF